MNKILLGVTACAAADKADELVAGLLHLGEVRVVLTPRSLALAHWTAETLSKIKRYHDENENSWLRAGDPIVHLDLRHWADIFIIAPMSANTLGKIANGICDNLLTNVARAWGQKKHMLVAPAMSTPMYEHPVTKEQLNKLIDWNIIVVPPPELEVSAGNFGVASMARVWDIVHTARLYLENQHIKGP